MILDDLGYPNDLGNPQAGKWSWRGRAFPWPLLFASKSAANWTTPSLGLIPFFLYSPKTSPDFKNFQGPMAKKD